ncbi:hypothetical protein CONPUDRAFT_149100 [Coniophora puteana RWD-64-598 SS2]|uniref:Uncharacterized protein n=1 Tax=Coniophora puteana (strain RWD-64-598) TaxID=741705 RepID=A0A5M3N880_CONPW|nr:uncharacterized protein CONPUDRAFT_149100 [Coniophora puteana RWD-64-598 SS2]EIW87061.1 hypothetical protein CONPUDRAFT_149100 [Coniophora puteana RWD-64-598 SS2]
MFPKFSSRARGGKPADVVPPPHTIYNRGICTLEIGPHTFTETTIFEVHYQAVAHPAHSTSITTVNPTNAHTDGLSTKEPDSLLNDSAHTPLLKSLRASMDIPPALISQVNSAATSNPTLLNLLQLAASGRATADQLKTLEVLIQSLASSPSLDSFSAPAQSTGQLRAPTSAFAASGSSHAHSQASAKEFDIVLEFRENPSDRWILPREPAICQYNPVPGSSGSFSDIILTTRVPFSSNIVPQEDTDEVDRESPRPVVNKEIVNFRLMRASPMICESMMRYIGPPDRAEENRKIIEDTKLRKRIYLAHKLPDGFNLTQIRNAASPQYPMKPMKTTSDFNKPRRRTAVRKAPPDGGTQATPAKRKRASQPKPSVPAITIACFACGQTDVPLIMGGRYCRPCVEGGKGIADIPQVGGARFTYRLPAPVPAQQPSSSAAPSSTPHTRTMVIDNMQPQPYYPTSSGNAS